MGWSRWLAAAAATVLTVNAWAWGNDGHRTVGAIADRLVAGTRAQQELQALLQPGESLETVSIWADCAKGYCGPLTGEMHEFVHDNPTHSGYHYTDLPFQVSAYADGAVGTTDHDVVQVLRQCIAVLRGDAQAAAGPGRFSRRQALLMAVHLVGDIHQPLHVGTAYLGQRNRYVVPATDAAIDGVHVFATHGDNALMVGSTPLHSYWDSRTVERAMKLAQVHGPGEFADFLLARHEPFRPDIDEPSVWPQRWADEAVRVSRQIHKGVVPGARREVRDRDGKVHLEWPVTLPAGYALTAANVTRERLRLAGMRLGVLMQTIWPAFPANPS